MITHEEFIQKEECNKRIRKIYREMLKYYMCRIGERSKYAGVIITPPLIDVFLKRYIQLGGDLKDLKTSAD